MEGIICSSSLVGSMVNDIFYVTQQDNEDGDIALRRSNIYVL